MVESGGLVRLMVNVLRKLYPQDDYGARQKFRLVLDKTGIDPLKKEVFLKFIFAEAWQGLESFVPLSEGQKILIGIEVFQQIFGEGEKFDRPAFSAAIKKVGLDEEEVELLEDCIRG